MKIYDYFFQDELHKNSVYLILSSLILTGLGFFFWTINARLFSASSVGLATALISAMGLIASLSGLGLGIALIRFLPKSSDKEHKINSCFTLSGLVAIVISTVFIFGLSVFSPKLLFIQKNLFYSLGFILFVVLTVWFNLGNSIFMALRKTKYILVKNVVFSLFKLIFPFVLVSLGAYGIFMSWGLSLVIGFIFVLFMLFRLGIKVYPVIYDSVIKKIFSFSFGNYVAGFLSTAPNMILPLLIINYFDPSFTAYFYVTLMIAGLLFVIPTSVSSSLLVEGSYSDNKDHLFKAVKIIGVLLIPSVLFLLFFGKYLLLLFGADYALNGFRLLQVFSLSSLFVAVKSVYVSLLNLKHKVKKIVLVNFVVSSFILLFSYIFIDYGLLGIGYGWLIGNAFILLFVWKV